MLDIKITKVEILTKEVVLSFDIKDSIKILLNTFLDFNLYESKLITEEDYNEIILKNEYYILKDYAYYLLKFRDYCEKELEHSLHRYSQNEQNIKSIINELKSKNYINDESYTKCYVEKMFNKGFSKNRVIKELEVLNIDEQIIYNSLIDYNEEEILITKIKKLFNIAIKKKTYVNAKKDIYQKCIYEGFDSSLVYELLENMSFDYIEIKTHDEKILENEYQKIKRTIKIDCDSNEFKVKLIRKLSTKGFSKESINELIRKDELIND